MGYYDFLMSPTLPKGRRPQDTGQSIKLFRSAEELPPEARAEEPEAATPSSFAGANPPAISSFQKRRGALADQIYEEATKELRSLMTPKGPGRGTDPVMDWKVKGLLGRIRTIDAADIPGVLEKLAGTAGPKLTKLGTEYRKLQFQPEASFHPKGDREFAEKKVAYYQNLKENLARESMVSVTDQQRKQISGELDIADQMIDQWRAKAAATPKMPQPGEAAPGVPSLTPSATLNNTYNDAGATGKDALAKDVWKFLKMWGDPVGGSIGSVATSIVGIVGRMGDEAKQRFYTHLVKEQRKEVLGEGQAQGAKQDVEQARMASERARVEMRQLFAKLNEVPEMHSFGSILAFVLLSLIFGPKVVGMLFLRKAEDKSLKFELDMMRDQIRDLDIQEREAQRRYGQAQRDVAARRYQLSRDEMMERARERGDVRRNEMTFDRQMRLLAAKQQAMLQSHPDKDSMLKNLYSSYNMKMSEAAKWGGAADRASYQGNDEEASAAEERFNAAMADAQDIYNSFLTRRKQLGLEPDASAGKK